MSTISFSCPHCAQKFEVPADKAGKKSKCPKCSKPITVPNRPLDLPKPVVIPRAAEAPATVQPQIIAIPVPQYEPEERRINHTHRTKGSFGTGFGLTFGCLMAFLLVSCGGVAFFVFGAGLFTAKVGQTIVNAQEKKGLFAFRGGAKSQFRQFVGQDFEPEVLFVSVATGPALELADGVVE
jgi:DNA-directed RNA polymerase subunit RPC12/RpoP